MAQEALNKILEGLDRLQPQELEQLERAVQDRLASQAERKRQAFHQALLSSGLVRHLKQRSASSSQHRPVTIQGKPLSETIIEERR